MSQGTESRKRQLNGGGTAMALNQCKTINFLSELLLDLPLSFIVCSIPPGLR
jgi:hypothetical protein